MQQPSNEQQAVTHTDLEQRLRTYYGPRLREQPLGQPSWEHIQRRLKPRGNRPVQLRKFIHRHRIHAALQPVPQYIEATYHRIADEADISYPASLLHCTLKRKRCAPAISVKLLRKQPVRLRLPIDAERLLPLAALDVLLASSIARYELTKKHIVMYWLLIGCITLIAGTTIFSLWRDRPSLSLLIVMGYVAGVLIISSRRKRSVCYRADGLVVTWIGRERVCEGLHVLAAYTHPSFPGRLGRLRLPGEPSIEQRIARVCGTRVESLTISR